MQPDSKIKNSDHAGWYCTGKNASSLAFIQSDHENLYLVNTVYLTLQQSSAELKQLVKQSVVTKPLCDLPDMDQKKYA